MKRMAYLATTLLLMAVTTHAQNAFTVADTNVPMGGQGAITVNFQFADEGQISAYQFYLTLPEGISLVPNGTRFVYQKGDGYDDAHQVSINYISEDNVYRVACAALTGSPTFSVTSGMLLTLPIQDNSSLAQGTSLNAGLSNVSLSTAGGSDVFLADVPFRIVIGEPSDIRTELFETSTELPAAANNVNVRVYRTINANEWSTICLPFAMTAAQVTEAFGNDVQLADFNDYDFDDEAGTISVKFTNATTIEANHPYIIKVSKGVTEFTANGVTIDPKEAIVDFDTSRRKNQPRQMVGTYVANTVLDWGTLFLSGNQFWYSIGSTKMKGYRAYFNFIDLLTEFEDNYEARINMSFEETSGIHDNNRETTTDSHYYDLQGRNVENPANKGLYISNGKKVVVK